MDGMQISVVHGSGNHLEFKGLSLFLLHISENMYKICRIAGDRRVKPGKNCYPGSMVIVYCTPGNQGAREGKASPPANSRALFRRIGCRLQ
jgi:hypothetical protein